MKKLLYLLLVVLVSTQCTNTDESLSVKTDKTVNMKFQVDGKETIVPVTFTYNKVTHHYALANNSLVIETKAVNQATNETMLVYSLKETQPVKGSFDERAEIKVGYYGYSPQTGCYYFGTLVIDDNNNSIFFPATGLNAAANPPLCGYIYA